MADQKAPPPTDQPSSADSPFIINGVAGGPFAIYGTGFSAKGTVTIGGRTMTPTAWYTRDDGTTVIKGTLPPDIGAGAVVIESGHKTFTASLGGKKK